MQFFLLKKHFLLFVDSLELQKKMPWFCVHEPEPSDDSSQNSAITEKSGVVMETSS